MSEMRRTCALLVIDAQASFSVRPYWDATLAEHYLDAQNRLIAGFVARQLPIVRIFHVEPEGAFSLASGLVRPLSGLIDYPAALEIRKHAHSALAGTALSHWLTAHGIRRLAVSGIRSEQCCETTTRDASDRGFAVDYVTEATLTFPMQHASGRQFSAEDIKQRCELVLADRFARIHSVDSLLADLDGGEFARAA